MNGDSLRSDKAVASVWENEEWFRQLAEHMRQVFWMTTADCERFIYVSPVFEEVWKRTVEDLYGDPGVWRESIHPRDSARVRGAIEHRAGGEYDEEYRIVRPDGSVRWIRDRAFPVRDDDGEISRIVGIAEDVTKNKILESQLVQAQKLESIGQLAAGIAHEINTPAQYVGDNTRFLKDAFDDLLRLIKEYRELTDRLKTSGGSDELAASVAAVEGVAEEIDVDYLVEDIPKAIEQSLGGLRRVSEIVHAMKEFSHPGKEEKSFTDLNKAMESTITVSRNEWKYVAEVVTDFDAELPLVPCLPGEINQLLLNLIINAAHAIEGGISEGSEEKGTITISRKKQDDFAEVRVRDTGTGIPPEICERVFDPFFTTKEIGKGTGQGLAIARSVVVDKHQGSIDFETVSGEGTTFIVRLPLSVDTPVFTDPTR